MNGFDGRDDEIREEMEFHRSERARRLREQGRDEPEAHGEAGRRFGNELKWQEETRRVHVAAWVDGLAADARLAWRSIVRRPGFSTAAVLTMAIGIGSAAAVFSVVDPILFRDLPYGDPGRLVSLGMVAPIEKNEFLLGADYFEWKQRQLPFSALTTWSGVNECDLDGESPVRLNCGRVEANFLPVLGVQPALGRNFRGDEDRPNAQPVVLISHDLWRSRFGGDGAIVGRLVQLDGAQARVVGVLPSGFELPNLAAFDLLTPQSLDPAGQRRPRTGAVLRAFGRLAPGVSVAQAEARMRPLFEASLQYVPAAFRKDVRFKVQGLKERQTQESRTASWLLLGTVAMVVLTACANLASLLLMRAAARARELGVRMALGARRWQLARLVLVESCALALAGGVLGCAIAVALLRVFGSMAPEGIPRLADARVDLRVLAAMLALTVVCGLLAGSGPALRSASVRPSKHRAGQTLVVAQIAASIALLALAGVLGRAFLALQAAPMGLDGESVSVARVTLPRSYAQPERRRAFFDQLEARLGEMPGAVAALADTMPLAGVARTMIYSLVEVEGRESRTDGTGGMVVWREVTPRYFEALRIPIVEGRGFNADDQLPGRDVMILSRALARRILPGQSVLGRRIRVGRGGPWRLVIGVAGDVRNAGLAPAQDPEYYLPRPHVAAGYLEPNGRPPDAQRSAWVLVRDGARAAAAGWIERTVHSLDRAIPVTVESLPERVRQLSSRERFQATLLTLLGVFTLGLASAGIYAAIAFLVVRRTQEFGVRMALGALPRQMSGLMTGLATRWLLLGAPFGLVLAWGAARALRAKVPGVSGTDPWALALAVCVVGAICLAAAWWPSRAAARVDPASVLRLNEER